MDNRWAVAEEGKSAAAGGVSPLHHQGSPATSSLGEVDQHDQQRRHRLRRVGAVGGWVLAAAAVCALLGTEPWRKQGGARSSSSSSGDVGNGRDGAHQRPLTRQYDNVRQKPGGPGSAGEEVPKPFEACCIAQELRRKAAAFDETEQQRSLALLALNQLWSSKPLTGALYAVLEEGRDLLLGQSLSQLNQHFCLRYDAYPVLVFEAFNVTDAQREELQARAPACPLEFHRLAGPASAPPGEQRKRLVLRALMGDVADLLSSRFELVLHITDRTLLAGDVLFDPLAGLAGLNHTVGYWGITGPPPGTAALWQVGHDLVTKENLTSSALRLTWDSPKCAEPRWLAYRTHLLTSPLYRHVMETIDKAMLDPAAHLPERDLPAECAVLTLGALVALSKDDFYRFPDTLVFEVPPPNQQQAVLGGGAEGAMTVSTYGEIEIRATEAPDLQPLFDVRKRGWLGADVGTSFRFPPRHQQHANTTTENSNSSTEASSEQSMWIFGDTFLGFSSRTRRLPEAFFLHNTIALAPRMRSPPTTATTTTTPTGGTTRRRSTKTTTRRSLSPEDIEFHWNTSSGGCPTSIFVRSIQDNECTLTESYYWPVSGIGVQLSAADRRHDQSSSSSSYLVLLAVHWAYMEATNPPDLLTNDTFNFNVMGTTIIVVDNPHDPPQSWVYRTKDMPGTTGDFNWYSSMVLTDGRKDLATHLTDELYLFGNNGTKIFGSPDEISAQVLARVSVQSLLDLSLADMRVWTKPIPQPDVPLGLGTQEPSWLPYKDFLEEKRMAVKIAVPTFSETSVNYSPYLGKWYSTQVDWLSAMIMLYLADDVTGPWDYVPVYAVPLPYSDLDYFFTYAGKAHPELASSDKEIVITYVANTFGDIDPLFEKGAKGVYVPRFVRLELSSANMDIASNNHDQISSISHMTSLPPPPPAMMPLLHPPTPQDNTKPSP